MRFKIILFLLFSTLLAAANNDTYDYNVDILTGISGPSCSQVETLYIDPEGLLWLGTGSTVERYDGNKYVIWDFEERTTFPDENKVTAITCDANRDFWIGNIHGVWKLNPTTFKIDRVLEDINVPVARIAADNENTLYIATLYGLYVFAHGKLQHLLCDKTNNPRGNSMVDMVVECPTCVWGLTPNGVVRNNTVAGVFNKYNLSGSDEYGDLKCFVKVKNTLFIGTENKGVLKFSIDSGAYSPFVNHWKSAVSSLCLVDSLTLAVGTENDGLSLVDLRDGKLLYSAKFENNGKTGIASGNVSSIVAKGNNIWCGNPYYIGWTHLSRDKSGFKLYETPDFKSANRPVRSFLFTPRYSFVGTRDGFYVSDNETGKTTYFAQGEPGADVLTSNLIFSFFKYGDEYLVGTCFGGLYKFHPETMSLSSPDIFSGMSSNDIFSYSAIDDRNRLWIPTRGGLFCYDQAAQKVTGYTTINSNLPSNIVYCVLIDSKKRFWTTTDKGVFLFNSETGKFSDPACPDSPLSNTVVKFAQEDSRGNLFFITIYDELWMLDTELKKSRRLFADKNIDIRNIIEDNFGNYWLGTSTGLIKTDKDMRVIATYFNTEEIPDLEASSGSPLWKDADGDIWMAGTKGLVEIIPSKNDALPQPKLVRVSVDGINVMDISTTGLRPLSLKKGDNNVTFHLMDSSYGETPSILLEYKLDGYDKDWMIKTGDSDLSYYHLPPGTYILKVRPYLGDKVIEMLEVKVAGISTVWIWTGAILLLAICILLLYRYRKRVISLAKHYIIRREEQNRLDSDTDRTENPEAEESPKMKFSEREMEEMSNTVKKYLEESKAYLNPDFKQPDLAAATGYSSQILSMMFNRYLNVGYYDFINAYRIDTFKRLIDEGANDKYTLMTIADMSGFKSHTSFFRTFKKFTGLTPNDYIRQHKQQ